MHRRPPARRFAITAIAVSLLCSPAALAAQGRGAGSYADSIKFTYPSIARSSTRSRPRRRR